MQTECLKDKVILKLADASDLPDIFKLVDAYDGPLPYDKKLTKNNLRDIVYFKGALLGLYNDQVIGGVAGYVLPSLFKDELTFCVMFLFIMPEYRRMTKQFIQEVELSLLGTKVNKIVFGFPSQEADKAAAKMKRFIRILGYKELEVHYQKRFTDAD